MQDIQEVFNKIQVVKKQQKELKTAYRDALTNSGEYKEMVEQLNALKEKKKQLETTVKEEFASELDKLEELKIDLESQNLLLSDIALSKIMNGETVELVDAYNNAYEPVFSVKFKKTNIIKEGEKNAEAATETKPREASNLSFLEINPSLE